MAQTTPWTLTPEQISDAKDFLAAHWPPTRLVPASSLSTASTRVSLKLESEQPTGSFKVRGALYALHQRAKNGGSSEAVTASTGNHGAAVAYAAQQMRMPATIFLPEHPNPVKAERIRRLGATLREVGRTLAETLDHAAAYATANDAYFVQDAVDADIPIGVATIVTELITQAERIDAVVVPVGDTALIRGIAGGLRAARRRPRVVGVQAEQAPAYFRSWRSGHVEGTDSADTIADGLATTRPIAGNVDAIRDLVDDIVLVSEAEMIGAIGWLAVHEHLIAEPAGAASTAAFRKGAAEGAQNVVLIVTGCNVTPDVLRESLHAR